MVFSSLVFLSIFLPVVWMVQLCLPSIRLKNAALLAASLLFYAYGEPVYVCLLLGNAVLNWSLVLGIGNVSPSAGRASRRREFFLVCAVGANLSLLAVFKYAGFFVRTLNSVFLLAIPVPEIALPIGISFYTFQALSYVIDVYRGSCRVQRNFPRLLLYISFFPQLIAGPIVRYSDIESELIDRRITAEETAAGIRHFVCGLSKKVLIANTCATAADALFAAPVDQLWAPSAWLAAFAYMMQIYFDFSGYSDMAIGLGRMFGFHFGENFRYPYAAGSVREFWRRWHISLSVWLKEYLYIPLGGSRRGKIRTIVNKYIVFLACGLWHGANWTFLFWGLWHGSFQMAEELIQGIPARRNAQKECGAAAVTVPGDHQTAHGGGGAGTVLRKILAHIYTMLAVLTGFVFFRADTLRQGFDILVRMFTALHAPSEQAVQLLWSCMTSPVMAALCVGMVACLPVKKLAEGRRGYRMVTAALCLAGIAVCILCLAGGTYNPFIYFRF